MSDTYCKIVLIYFFREIISQKKSSYTLSNRRWNFFGTDRDMYIHFGAADAKKKYDARKVAIQKHNVLKLESWFLILYTTKQRGRQGDLNFFCHFFVAVIIFFNRIFFPDDID